MRASTPVMQPSQSGYLEMTKSSIDVTTNGINTARSGIDHAKRYTINGVNQDQISNNSINMKKSTMNLKYAPPTLAYQ